MAIISARCGVRSALQRRIVPIGTAVVLALLQASGVMGTTLLFPASSPELSSASAKSSPHGSAPATAMSVSITGGRAWVDNAALVSGATLYPGERVLLDSGATALLSFAGGTAFVAPQSALVIESQGLRLDRGAAQLRQEVASSFTVQCGLFRVGADPESNAPVRSEIVATPSGGRVTTLAGIVQISAAGDSTTYRLYPGRMALLGDQIGQPLPALSSSAGQITHMVPVVQMDRGAQHLNAAVQSPVLWNDLLQSGRMGRARIALNDGSLLNLGSDSSLRVLQHDAAAQQTELDLAIGRVRARVVKLTRPGSKFEVRTPSAVAGIVGTDFYLYATPDFTELIVFEGIVRLTSLATGQATGVGASMKIVIQRSGQAEGPVQATAAEIAEAQSLTDVPEIAQAAVGAGNKTALIVLAASSAPFVGLRLALRGTQGSPISPSSFGPGNETGAAPTPIPTAIGRGISK